MMHDRIDAAKKLWAKRAPLTNLCSITRRPDTCRTVIDIVGPYQRINYTWIICGESHLRMPDRRDRGDVTLCAYLDNATDFEHDSGYALQLPLIGWQFQAVEYHAVSFAAWVNPKMDPQFSKFCVPDPGYNPMEHPDASDCENESCVNADGPHRIVPEGFYVPPHNQKLYDHVRGERVRITIRPTYENDDQ